MRIDLNPDDIKSKRPDIAKPIDLTLGQTIKTMREAARLTQLQAATVMGLERTSVTNMELGKQRTSIENVAALADYLGLEVVISLKPKAARPREGRDANAIDD